MQKNVAHKIESLVYHSLAEVQKNVTLGMIICVK